MSEILETRPIPRLITGLRAVRVGVGVTEYALASYQKDTAEQRALLYQCHLNTVEHQLHRYLYGSFWRKLRTLWNAGRKKFVVMCTPVEYTRHESGGVQASMKMDIYWEDSRDEVAFLAELSRREKEV